MKKKNNNFKTYIQIDPFTGMEIVLKQKNEIPMESIEAIVMGTDFDKVVSILKKNGTCCSIDGKVIC